MTTLLNSPRSDVCQPNGPSAFDVFLKFSVKYGKYDREFELKFFCGLDLKSQIISLLRSTTPYGASNLGTQKIGSLK